MSATISRHAAVLGRSALSILSGRLVATVVVFLLVLFAAEARSGTPALASAEGAPATLHETGLYLAPGSRVVDPEHLGFAPQYPLWTDGASKRRWISVPPGELIDASDPDRWDFPVGTRFWKEFAFDDRPVETRYMERRADGSWIFATYVWDAGGTAATLAPAGGILRAHEFGDGSAHAIPSLIDCGVCHLSGGSPVLGFGPLQLSDDRDPDALHAEPGPAPDLRLSSLVERGLVTGLDRTLVLAPPRTSTASDTQRTALGYLHGNCGHCHNPVGPLKKLGLFLRQGADEGRAAALSSTVKVPLVKPPAGILPGTLYRVAPGDPHLSAIPQRMGARASALQMPPIGTYRIDAEAVDLINRWISESWIPHASNRHNVSD